MGKDREFSCLESLTICSLHRQLHNGCIHCDPGMSGIQDVEVSTFTCCGSHAAVQQASA